MKQTPSVLRILFFSVVGVLVCVLSSCSGNADKALPPGDTLTHASSLMTLVDHGDFVSVTIADPWSDGKATKRYALVPRDSKADYIPEDMTVIKTPVQSTAVFSSVHSAPLEELGATGIIRGVADADYFTSPAIRSGLADGRITDVGNSMSPSLETLVNLSPDVAIVSPYQGADYSAISKTGIAVVEMVDYMEPTPLGRAEWILLLGALTGRLDQAKNIYANVCDSYNKLAKLASQTTSRPLVVTDTEYSGQWAQPGGASYAARMIADAGARVLFADRNISGSVNSDYALVYEKGSGADFWLIRHFGNLTPDMLRAANSLNSSFKAFSDHKVYFSDTSTSGFYDDIAFHPEKILADYVAIFHPELSGVPKPHYFHNLFD